MFNNELILFSFLICRSGRIVFIHAATSTTLFSQVTTAACPPPSLFLWALGLFFREVPERRHESDFLVWPSDCEMPSQAYSHRYMCLLAIQAVVDSRVVM